MGVGHRASINVSSLRLDYTVTNVTTGAWVEINPNLVTDVNELEIFDGSGQTMELGYGAAGAEQRALLIIQGGNGQVAQILNKTMRLAVRAVSGTANSGELTINFYR